MERACKKCQNTGWCHAMQKCRLTGETLIAKHQPEAKPMQLPVTIAQRIAELAKASGDDAALAKARELVRAANDVPRDRMYAAEFVDHSEAVFIDGKLFTIKLQFDIPGESRLPEGIEPPFYSSPTPAEDQLLAGN